MKKRVFITGCDSNTEWQLPWFIENFLKAMPDEQLIVYDFGMDNPGDHDVAILKLPDHSLQSWFKKPLACVEAARAGLADDICWLDTDCQILGDITDIWNPLMHQMIGLVEDRPWSTRRGGTHYNTGVVAWRGYPEILDIWLALCEKNKDQRGDQEVLHEYLKIGLNSVIHITDLRNSYNTLRLQIQDKTLPKVIKVMHWTGPKGDKRIREMMND